MVQPDVTGVQHRFVDSDAPPAVDFYAGGGGGSLGVKEGGFNVICALNHNQTCIDTHKVNFPLTEHIKADIFKLNPAVMQHLKPRVGWFSPSCVFFSVARGGRPCNEQERAHAEQMPRFCYALNLEVVYVENVKEFIKWGPLTEKRDKQGNIVQEWNAETQEWDIPLVPDKKRQGEYYQDWLRTMKEMGYTHYEYRFLNAADYGTPQTRVRYFGIFTRGMPIVWPKPTHDQHGRNGLPKWNGVRNCLQLHKKGRSIFNRTKTSKKGTRPDPLSDNTLLRIRAGLEKLVVGAVGEEKLTTAQVLFQNNGTRTNDTVARATQLLCKPARALTTNGGNQFLMTYYRHGGTRLLNQPSATVTTKDRLAKVEAEGFLFSQQFSNAPRSLDDPSRTLVASRRHPYLVQVGAAATLAHLAPQSTDSAVMLELKAFCLAYGITDVFMRMLFIEELKLIMGFPADYKLLGTETEQKKMIGNAVAPAVAAALARAMLPTLHQWRGRRLPPLRRGVMLRWEQGALFQNCK